MTITPAGFDDFFAAVGALLKAQQTEMPKPGVIAARHGLEFVASTWLSH